MKTTEQLKALAERATPGPWKLVCHTAESPDEITAGCDWTIRGDTEDVCHEGGRNNHAAGNAQLIAASNPTTIKELCELVEMMEEALLTCKEGNFRDNGFDVWRKDYNDDTITEALDRVAKFQKGE